MWALLSADSAALIHATLNAMAHKTIHLPGGDDRTADQRRADALVDLARTTLCDTNRTNTGPTDTGPTDTGPDRHHPAVTGRLHCYTTRQPPTGADRGHGRHRVGPRPRTATRGAGHDRCVHPDGSG